MWLVHINQNIAVMKVIGKADKFYTLWEVTEETRTSLRGNTYKIVHHQYFKNISFDLDKAKAKYPNAIVDETLRGHHSWSTYEYEKLPSDEFQGGKYKGEKIIDCTDYQYLYWAFDLTNIIPVDSRDIVEEILTKAGYRRINDSHIATPEEVEMIEKSYDECENAEKNIEELGSIFVTPTKNLDNFGNLTIGNIEFTFPNYKELEYAGYLYGLPIDSNGKVKRIKNKKLEIIPESWELKINENGWGATLVINVKDFKIIK